MADNIDLEQKIDWYEDALDSSADARSWSERDRRYYDHIQWTDEEVATLKKRGQAAITINRIQPKVDFLLGMERTQRTDPKAFPRTPVHEDGANAATDSIRYICDNNDFDAVRSDAFENMLIEGTGAAIVDIKVKPKGDKEIRIKHIHWDRIFWDPHSRKKDFSDARYTGIVTWMDKVQAIAKFPGKENMIDESLNDGAIEDTFEDTPRSKWNDASRDRVRIIEMYYEVNDVWYRCVFTKGGELEESAPCVYVDEDGVPDNPMIMQSAKVDQEGNRYGFVRTLIDAQDEINKRRSKALHLLSVRQTKGERGAVKNVTQMKSEMAKADGHVEYQKGFEWDIINTGDMAQAQFNLLQEAKAEIDAVGANAAMQGKEERNMSGRALQARQQSGQIELGPLFDQLRSWQKRIYKSSWNRIKQFWTDEKWIRVTDDENNLKWVGLNAPVTLSGLAQQHQARRQQIPPEQAEQADQSFFQMVQSIGLDPFGPPDQVASTVNDVVEMDVDIILEDVPDVVSLQTEQFDLMVQLFQSNPNGVPWDIIIEMSQLRNKKAIIERLKGDEQAQAAAAQEAERQKGIQEAMANAEISEKAAKTTKDQAHAGKLDAETKQVMAETAGKVVEIGAATTAMPVQRAM